MLNSLVFLASSSTNTNVFPDWVKILLQFIIFPILYFFVRKLFRNALVVKEIKKKTDKDIAGFVSLYKKRIKESMRIDSEEILAFINRKSNTNVDHHLYVCKHDDKVVGFVKFMISKSRKGIFIAYIAIDQEDQQANKVGVQKLLRKMLRKYFKPRYASYIITEIEQGKGGNYNTSLAKTITRYALSNKFDAYYIDAPYIQPRMPGENSNITSEDFMSLIYIPYFKPDNSVISKNNYIGIIEFIYLDVYGPSCNEVVCDCGAYNNYLYQLIDDYRREKKDYIEMIRLGESRV